MFNGKSFFFLLYIFFHIKNGFKSDMFDENGFKSDKNGFTIISGVKRFIDEFLFIFIFIFYQYNEFETSNSDMFLSVRF